MLLAVTAVKILYPGKEKLTPQVQLPAAQPQLAQEQEALPQPPAIVVDVKLLSWCLKKSGDG